VKEENKDEKNEEDESSEDEMHSNVVYKEEVDITLDFFLKKLEKFLKELPK
jgi:hypothetical protein